MSKTITTTLTLTIQGDGLNETHSYQALNQTAAPAVYIAPATGNVGITVASYPGMAGALVVPPSPLGSGKTLKGANPDAGVTLNPNMPVLVTTLAMVIALGAASEPLHVKLI